VTFPVDQLIPGTPATTVHVVSRSGRVAAALSDSQVNGLAALGADWVPAAGEPGLTSVLTGIPGDPDATRTLLLVAPGGDDAVVNLHLVTAEGTLSPDALQGLSVPAGKLFQLVVPPPADGGAFAVVVEADRPVVAGVRTVRAGTAAGGSPDFSYAAGQAPVAGALVLPTATRSATVTTQLQLTNPTETDIVVDLTTVTAGTPAAAPPPPTTQRVTVTAGTTLQVPVGRLGAAPSSVLVQAAPGTIGLYAGWVLSEAGVHGPLVTGGPLPQTAQNLLLPAMAADPATGYSGH
jgi:hypothetical protein